LNGGVKHHYPNSLFDDIGGIVDHQLSLETGGVSVMNIIRYVQCQKLGKQNNIKSLSAKIPKGPNMITMILLRNCKL
jgi:hypothetical protein